MKYLFILGRNVELSVEEIKSFLKRYGIGLKQIGLFENGLLIECNGLPKNSIEKLGGAISLGEVIASGNAKEIIKELDKKTLYQGEENKLNYVLHDFGGDYDEISLYLKARFREEGLKATEKKPTGSIKMQGGEFAPHVVSKNIDEEYFVFGDNFGRIVQKSDYESLEERDMKKPVRRNELSISPRLAKILINLSEVKERGVLLDPFCGIGTIMQEAILQGINAIGIDRDKNAIADARTNLKWFGFNEGQYRLMNDDSSKAKLHKIDGIATEPELGELQKRIPSEKEAKEITKKFEELMIKVLKNLKNFVSGRIAFTAPLILTGRERISCDISRIAKACGLKVLMNIPEFRERSIVGRNIAVLEK